MKIYRTKGIVPPGGMVRYKDPDDGWTYAHPYYDNVKVTAHNHRVAVKLPIPYDWDQVFDQAVCSQTPGACIDVPEARNETKVGLIEMAANFSKAVLGWAKKGFPVTPYDQFRERYLICAGSETQPRCQYFQEWTEFGVSRCTKCGCLHGIKLRLQSERCPINRW